nr:phage head closure protein [uncultured Tyzzerella sp.]
MKNKNYSLDDVCILLTFEIKTNNIGIETKELLEQRKVYCIKESISRSEFYQAEKHNIKAELKLTMLEEEYQKEKQLLYNDKKYKIYKTYIFDKYIELYCEAIE